MTTDKALIDSAVRGWKSNVERADKLFGGLSPEQLEQEVAPGRNRLIYLWGHLAAANDGLLTLLGIGERLHPEFDALFTANPDKSVPLTVSGPSLKAAWQEIKPEALGRYLEYPVRDGDGFHCIVPRRCECAGRRGEFHHRLGDRSRGNIFDRQSHSLAHGSGMEEPHGHRGTHRGPTISEAMSHSMMYTSTLEREELRIFEELISRFDSLSEAQMSAVAVTPEWSAKDLLAHLAYWERAAAEQVRDFEAGRWSAKKRTCARMESINREVVSANRATPRHLLREELILARSEIVAAMNRVPEELEERSPLAHIVYSQCVRHMGHHLEQLQAWVARLGKTS